MGAGTASGRAACRGPFSSCVTVSWLQLCYSRLEHRAKDTRDKLAERWMPAQAVQDPACARHAGAQAQRVPAPPRTLLFPAGKPVARSSHSPLLGKRGISTRLSPAWLQGSRLCWRPCTALCTGAQQTADGIRRPETCRLRLVCAGKAPKHPDAGRKQLPSPHLRTEQQFLH